MKELNYVITDELGIHARPAGLLVKKAMEYNCDISVGTKEKLVDAKRIMGVMGLALKQGDTLTMVFNGDQEEEAAAGMEAFLKANL